MDTSVERLVEAARRRRQRVHVAAAARQPAAARRLGAEPRQSSSGRLRPRVGRHLLVPVGGGRDVELVVVVARRPAARRRARLELRVDGL